MLSDFTGKPMKPGDWAVMYSTQEGKLIFVQIVKYNPGTNRVTVRRHKYAGAWTKNEFATPDYPHKFFRVDKAPED